MKSQQEKGDAFRALHEREGAFIIPNPWDLGTARLLAQLGFEALATTGAGYAFSRGQRDGTLGRDRMMRHVEEIAAATELPLSADLENGFGDDPEVVAETIRMGADRGLVGASIEDFRYGRDDGLYEPSLAKERIQAAAEAAASLPFAFTLTARCENFLAGRPDLDDTIERLRAYQEAGADVLYAPGLTSREEIAAVANSVERPVNVVMGLQGVSLSLSELSSLGVKRVSLGSTLSRVAFGAFLRAGRELLEQGTFGFAQDAVAYPEINAMFES
jgi:2-methylisocitrate lyase-like PEP mutase family enzyme